MPRLFIALRPPDHIADPLIDTMEAVPGARWQDADHLHITLRFIGEVDGRTADDLAMQLARIRAAPFPVRIAGTGHFEKSRRSGAQPHAIWARVEDSAALESLRQQVEHACAMAGLPRETRRFVPHITLARLNGSSGPVGPWLARHGTLSAGPWMAQAFALYESRLSAHGSEYRALIEYSLQP